MRCRNFARGMLLAVLAAFGAGPHSHAEDAPADEAADKKLQALVEESVNWYELSPDAESKTVLKPQVALRWRNASRGQTAEDLMVLWIHDGRPLAAASVFPWQGHLCQEFASLSRHGGLVARDQDNLVWSPKDAGAEFRDVPAAPVPADTAAGRLRQMKSLSSQFAATMTGWKADNSDREELRLLPRPLYRYEVKEGSGSHADLLDGAVFAFVQGTDPEALLLLEAVRQEGGLKWQYAFARATSGGLEGRVDKNLVWTAEKYATTTRDPTKPQIVVRRPINP